MPNAVTANVFNLLAKYGDCESSTSVIVCEGIDETEFSDKNGTRHRGCLTATRYLAGTSSKASQLLGETAEQQAKVTLAMPRMIKSCLIRLHACICTWVVLWFSTSLLNRLKH